MRHLAAFSILLALLATALVPAAPAHAGATCVGPLSAIPNAATDGAQFGAAVAVAGRDVLAGAPGQARVYVYRRGAGGLFTQPQELPRPASFLLTSGFGSEIAVDGTIAVVGAPFHNSSQGAVAIYARASDGTWSFVQTITSPIDLPNGCFGFSIAMADGFLAIGAPAAINASQFARGVVYLFARDAGANTYSFVRRFDPDLPTAAQDKFFGWCVGMANSTLAISAPGEILGSDGGREGSAYVYTRDAGGLWNAVVRLKSPSPSATFGTDLAAGTETVGGTGCSILVREQNLGSPDVLRCYRMVAGVPLLNSSTVVDGTAAFGGAPATDIVLTNTLAVREGLALVGGPDDVGTNSRVLFFQLDGVTWGLGSFLNGPANNGCAFGQGVGLGHDQFAVGAPAFTEHTNYQPGLLKIGSHTEPDCDLDGISDACVIAASNPVVLDIDRNLDGIPDGCQQVATPALAFATEGTLSSGIGLSWSGVPRAARYKVTLATDAGETLVAFTYAPQYLDTTAAVGSTQTYRVRAESADGTLSDSFAAASGWRLVGTPANVVATNGTSMASVTVAWGAVTGATGYQVLRTLGGVTTTLATVSELTYTDTTGTPGVVYTYAVRATGAQGDGAVSAGDAGWRAATNAPLTVSASDGTSDTSITVNWTAPEGGSTGFTILRGEGTKKPAVIASVGAGVRTYVDSAVPKYGKAYRYTIRLASATTGGIADFGFKAPLGTSSVTATDGTASTGVTVTWAAPPATSKVTGFGIFRTAPGGAAVLVGTTTKKVFTFTDLGAAPGVLYTYTVRASSSLGPTLPKTDSGWRKLAPPIGLSATNNQTNKVALAWTNASGATGYVITRTGGSGPATFTSIANSYDDTTADVGVTYTYVVASTCGLGNSANSVSVTGVRLPAIPTGLAATTDLADKVALTWGASTGATGYVVIRTGGGATVTFTSSGTGYDDTSAAVGVTYQYGVRATCAAGSSAYSAAVSGTRVAGFRMAAAGAGETGGATAKGAGPRAAGPDAEESVRGTLADELAAEAPHTWLIDAVKLHAGDWELDARDVVVAALRDPADEEAPSVLLVTGRAVLGGDLVVAFDGHEPRVGDRWTILVAGAIEGGFRAVIPFGLPEGLRLEARAMGPTFELEVVAADGD